MASSGQPRCRFQNTRSAASLVNSHRFRLFHQCLILSRLPSTYFCSRHFQCVCTRSRVFRVPFFGFSCCGNCSEMCAASLDRLVITRILRSPQMGTLRRRPMAMLLERHMLQGHQGIEPKRHITHQRPRRRLTRGETHRLAGHVDIESVQCCELCDAIKSLDISGQQALPWERANEAGH